MRKTLLILSLATLLLACDQQLDPSPEPNPEQILSATDDVADALVTVRGERIVLSEGIRAIGSGPAAMPEDAERSANSENVIQPISFEPNAGVIWFDGVNTHLMALQLPGSGSSAVKYASLGTGWQGATHIAMDRGYFYVVWKNAIYRSNKKLPGVWAKVVPSNGNAITGLVGLPDGELGFNFSRISYGITSGFYHYSFGSYIALGYYSSECFPSSECLRRENDVKGLALFKSPQGTHYLMNANPTNISFYPYAPHFPVGNTMMNSGYVSVQNSSSGRPTSVVGNPMSQSFFYSLPSVLLGSPQVFELKLSNTTVSSFSYIRYTPNSAPLVVNNGYVWIMGDVLQRLVTFGPNRGKSAYNEHGWGGIRLACADPTLVF
jgi:hypothetical protein